MSSRTRPATWVAQHLGIPKSTVASWMRRGLRDVVTLDSCERDSVELRADVVRLERRVRVLPAIVRLLLWRFAH